MSYPSRPGLNSAGAYQVSGAPYVTGTVIPAGTQHVKIEFPAITKSVTVISKNGNRIWPTSSFSGSAEIGVFFGKEPSGSYPYPQIYNNHYITIPAENDGLTLDVKCSQIFIFKFDVNAIAGVQILAELTSIDKFDLYRDGIRDALYTSGTVDD